MKKSELKALIREVVQESGQVPYEVVNEWGEPFINGPDKKVLKMMAGKKILSVELVNSSEIKIIFSNNESVMIWVRDDRTLGVVTP